MTTKNEQLAYDILTNAIEAPAIHYWTCQVEWKRIVEQDNLISEISFKEFEEGGGLFDLTPIGNRIVIGGEQVINAMRKITLGGVKINTELESRIALMYKERDYLAGVGGDAETDDVIVQVAALGEIVYG